MVFLQDEPMQLHLGGGLAGEEFIQEAWVALFPCGLFLHRKAKPEFLTWLARGKIPQSKLLFTLLASYLWTSRYLKKVTKPSFISV